ncbi:AfsR/SARP family transcriptional regulator, partial [Kitasatospora sp. NPDC054939]
MLRISVLGPLRARRGGRELDLGPPKQRAVLAALALGHGRVVPVAELEQAVWGARPPATAAVAVRSHLSRLRAVIEPRPRSPRTLLSAPGGYLLRLEPDALDADRAERLAAEAARAAAAGDRTGAVRLLGSALALWEGVPLTGVPGDLADRRRDLFEERRLTLRQDRLTLELELGGHARLAAELTALADEHPLREGLRALQMVALYRCGQQAAALAGYERCRRLLAEELGVDPGPELADLHGRILRSDPSLAAPPSADATAYPKASPAGSAGEAPGWLPPAQLP